jgi:hypothetical protein
LTKLLVERFIVVIVIEMKKKRAIWVLLFTLLLPLPSTATAMEDMFGAMFRMMLVMMNVMSDAMLESDDTFDSGFGNSLGFGMGSWPAMNGLSGVNPMSVSSFYPGMSPWSGMGGFPGTSPWSSAMGGFPGTSPWSSGMGGFPGTSPWSSGMGGFPGTSPWSSGMGGFPGYGSGMSPWSTPFMGDSWSSNPYGGSYSPYSVAPYSPAGYGNRPGGVQAAPVSLLEGRWYGTSGEILEVRGNRFRLKHGKYAINGAINIENNIVNLFSQETRTVTRYTFIRNQTDLMLQDASGDVLSFKRRPGSGTAYVF